MTQKPDDTPPITADDTPRDPQRRRLLGGLVLGGAALGLGAC
jgi:hypothetical protein